MKRKFYTILSIFFVVIVALTISSEAAYQSRPNFSSLVNTTTNSFFENIRKMESADGPMGLNAEFKGQYPFVYLLLELFLESDEDDQVLVTPLGKAKKYYQPILEGFRELRRAGILEPD